MLKSISLQLELKQTRIQSVLLTSLIAGASFAKKISRSVNVQTCQVIDVWVIDVHLYIFLLNTSIICFLMEYLATLLFNQSYPCVRTEGQGFLGWSQFQI